MEKKIKPKWKWIYPVCIAIGVFLPVAPVHAEGSNVFKTSLSTGVTITDGNSETLQLNAALITEGEKKDLGLIRAGVEANYGESTVNDSRNTTVENARAFANAQKKLSTMAFASVDGSVLYDDIALIDYRVTIGPALGVYLVKKEKTSLSIEIGPSYIWERIAEADNDYMALRFGERLNYTISDDAKVRQSAEYLPQTDNFDNYLINFEVGAESALSTRLNLRLVLQDKYNSEPGEELEHNDLSLIGGISITL